MTRLGVAASIVDDQLVRGDVEISDGVVTAVGVSPAGRSGIAAPGFIDLQVNGFGDVDFLSTNVDGYRQAAEVLLSTGVTSFQPTLVSAPVETLVDALDVVAKALPTLGVRILGVHLEGPFLAPKWKGAHDERWIIPADIGIAERLCAGGLVTTLTLAPEQPGGMDLLRWLVAHGVLVSVGHSDADAAAAHEAYDAGARSVTHLHNAQRRFTARDPGLSAVAMTRNDVTVELIPDFVHLARETVLLAWRAAGRRLAVVTDAISAAPRSTGVFQLGDRTIVVSEDAARLADGTLAGSVLSMDKAVRNLVELGIPLEEAVRAATTVPARLHGREDIATLRPGTTADVVVLDDALVPLRTLRDGAEVWAR
ncbi:MAG TPA: N-acetylglucosamine-6-phosphate deacetylase [Mycobacteriales bacterium]|nr:N-acetylglucosamine-6-phosphate deacetylase [Mycobacteriales bacterium]